ncbi:hypothetical protein [Streptomyces sp. NBC_00162]|uniref:hypothetical protein n=1 Tax=Streptomyces sp. NBC_00162 TaxID=2903629 RepID=UPI00214BD315|nr:hypothetical protein [Streptomyces sp. NBC_00162]UUU45175.1 hypothetical protein JIW86_41335 [Streptomyces sp. NBC_00162]
MSVGHPEGADQGWGIAGAVAGIAALGVALWQLKLTAQTASSTAPAVTADGGSVAAAGTVRNARARDTAPGTGPGAAAGPGVSASGGSVAAGGDVDGASAHHGP